MKSFQMILDECLTALSNGTSTVDECLTLYPQYAGRLKPLLRTVRFLKLGRNVKPSHAFKAHSRAYLAQHLRFNPRYSRTMQQLSWRITLTLAMLMATLLFTGTVHAQSVMPGDNFYSWKRATEEIWRALSMNPVKTDIALSERRFHEWMAVADDPILATDAMQGYFEELNRLKEMDNEETHKIIAPVIQSHHEALSDAGLPAAELVNNFIALQATPVPVATVVQVFFTNTPVIVPTRTPQPTFTLKPNPTVTATPPLPTATNTPVPTVTSTDLPTATATQPEPTATQPEPSATPTEPPPATIAPTEPSPPTTAPTEPDPTSTPIQPVSTEVPPVSVVNP